MSWCPVDRIHNVETGDEQKWAISFHEARERIVISPSSTLFRKQLTPAYRFIK